MLAARMPTKITEEQQNTQNDLSAKNQFLS